MLNNIIFVDTSAIYAVSNKQDKHHKQAVDFVSSLPGDIKLIISNYVFVETWSLLNSRISWDAALAFYDEVLSKSFHLIDVSEMQLLSARKITEKYADHALSMVDATSFALMEYMGINKAFAFDYHFRIYRKADGTSFEILP